MRKLTEYSRGRINEARRNRIAQLQRFRDALMTDGAVVAVTIMLPGKPRVQLREGKYWPRKALHHAIGDMIDAEERELQR